MTIRFFCSCSQPLAAPDQYAGQTVRCTACNELQVVPEAASSNGPVPIWNPAADGFDGGPHHGEPGGWRKRLGLAASAVLLLAGVAGLWWLFFRGDPASSAEYDLVPRDALAFFTVKVSEVLKTAEGARALRLMPSCRRTICKPGNRNSA